MNPSFKVRITWSLDIFCCENCKHHIKMVHFFLKSFCAIMCIKIVGSQISNSNFNFKPKDSKELFVFQFDLTPLTGSSDCTIFLASSTLDSQIRKETPFWEYLESPALWSKIILEFDKDILKIEEAIQVVQYPFRFTKACTLVLHNDFDNFNIPKNFRKIIPGGIFQSYHLFLKSRNNGIDNVRASELSILPGLEILHFAFYDFDNIVRPNSVSELFEISNKPNWNLEPLKAKFMYGSGDPQLNIFKETGQWDQLYTAIVYYASQYMNASLVFDSTGIPSNGRTKSGSWSNLVEPLINGSAQICQVVTQFIYPPDLIFFSKPIVYTDISFISALPREKRLTAFETLISPFGQYIWMGILFSMAGMFLILQGSILFSLTQKSQPFSYDLYARRTAEAFLTVFRPILDQNGLYGNLSKLFEIGHSWRIFILWSLSAMIFSNLYKGEVISGFIKPYFAYAPRNFDELMNSNFKINAILYDEIMDKDLKSVNNTLAQFLLERTKDTGFSDGLAKVFNN